MTWSGSVVFKMSGSGNDFVMLDGRVEAPDRWPAERIAAVCARGTGLGADGVVFLSPGSRPGAVRFLYFNADGSPAGMCGNAALCATRLAAWLGMAPADGLVLETGAGEVRARCLPGAGELAEIRVPTPSGLSVPPIDLEHGERGVWLTTVGVPHLVVLVDDLASVAVTERGRALRYHAALAPGGANINFVACTQDGEIAMRTYERGVEAETLACGTGAVACVAALQALGSAGRLPAAVGTASGRTLTISATSAAAGRLDDVTITGEGRMIYRAIIAL